MLKIKLLISLSLLSFSSVAISNDSNPFLHENEFPKGYFLMPESLPHFMGVYRGGGKEKIKPSKEQATLIEEHGKKVLQFVPSTAVKIKKLETEIVNDAVFKGKTFSDLSDKLAQVATLRQEMTKTQLNAIKFLKTTLTPEQFEMMIELAKKHEHHEHETQNDHREHDAHEHGHAQLSVIVEKNELQIMLETPAMNVFGFEHKPENEKQHKTVESAVKDLKNFTSLLTLDRNAKCRLVKSEVKQPFDEEDSKDHNEEHDEKHDDKHEKEHEESAHTDVDVEVAFTCDNSSKLTTIDLTAFFKRFPLFEELDVQGIINGQQMAAELTKKQPFLSLKK